MYAEAYNDTERRITTIQERRESLYQGEYRYWHGHTVYSAQEVATIALEAALAETAQERRAIERKHEELLLASDDTGFSLGRCSSCATTKTHMVKITIDQLNRITNQTEQENMLEAREVQLTMLTRSNNDGYKVLCSRIASIHRSVICCGTQHTIAIAAKQLAQITLQLTQELRRREYDVCKSDAERDKHMEIMKVLQDKIAHLQLTEDEEELIGRMQTEINYSSCIVRCAQSYWCCKNLSGSTATCLIKCGSVLGAIAGGVTGGIKVRGMLMASPASPHITYALETMKNCTGFGS